MYWELFPLTYEAIFAFVQKNFDEVFWIKINLKIYWAIEKQTLPDLIPAQTFGHLWIKG